MDRVKYLTGGCPRSLKIEKRQTEVDQPINAEVNWVYNTRLKYWKKNEKNRARKEEKPKRKF